MDDVVNEFLIESYENLDRLDSEFVSLEEHPEEAGETLQGIFRTIHTIKGTCGFLGFGKLERVTHVGENLLSKLRDGVIAVDQEITTALLSLVDAVRTMLAEIESTGSEGEGEYGDLIATLSALQDDERLPEAEARVAAAQASADAAAPVAATASDDRSSDRNEPDHAEAASARGSGGDPAKSGQARGRGASGSTIRVDVELLDRLMNLVGELVLARNQVLQHTGAVAHAALQATSQRLNLITSELQEGVMKTRMQPIAAVWSKFPRVVRDLAVQCGKRVALVMEGKETELDKTLIEAIKDPLTHIVRNSIDHGIEAPDVRERRGKPAEGTLRLRAYHEGGQVVVDIVDDGGGIDPDRVVAKALERGLLTPEQASRLGEREMVALIMRPGFSTAEKVTNVSGRGVGMDVVKTNIEAIGGSVEVQSQLGVGTTMRIRIPLTLAIVPALLVTADRHRYAIPQANLLELVRLEGAEALEEVQHVHGSPVYRLRGRILPLVHLREVLGKRPVPLEELEGALNIVVLQAEGSRFGLVVDRVNDTEEIVVKPLGRHLKQLAVYSGATIMGDGAVALILDVAGIGRERGLLGAHEEHVEEEDDSSRLAGVLATGEGHLLVSPDGRARLGIPLSRVSRLEELDPASLEWLGEHQVVQYRGEIMPLVFLDRLLGFSGALGADETDGRLLQVVVFSHRGQSVGLEVGHIVDIVAEAATVRSDARRFGVEGSVVLQGRITELLDVEEVLDAVLSSFSPAALVG